MAGDADDLIRVAVATASTKKAIEPMVLDVSSLVQIVDYFVILSGANRRQVATLVEEIREKLRDTGFRPLRMEGVDDAEWVLLDFGDVVIHIFRDEIRRFYDLERLWADAPRRTLTEV
jgi:ribosome-associated protein